MIRAKDHVGGAGGLYTHNVFRRQRIMRNECVRSENNGSGGNTPNRDRRIHDDIRRLRDGEVHREDSISEMPHETHPGQCVVEARKSTNWYNGGRFVRTSGGRISTTMGAKS